MFVAICCRRPVSPIPAAEDSTNTNGIALQQDKGHRPATTFVSSSTATQNNKLKRTDDKCPVPAEPSPRRSAEDVQQSPNNLNARRATKNGRRAIRHRKNNKKTRVGGGGSRPRRIHRPHKGIVVSAETSSLTLGRPAQNYYGWETPHSAARTVSETRQQTQKLNKRNTGI